MIWSNLLVQVLSVSGYIGSVSSFITEADILPDLVEIRSKSGQIRRDLTQISLDNNKISLDLEGSRLDLDEISPNWFEILTKLPKTLKLTSKLGFMGFEKGNLQPTYRGRDLCLITEVVGLGKLARWAGRLDIPSIH